ncbi:hypothetical protein IW261DRAFT_505 [Armillaria novae-zelandiae]|uniref:Uncharacterized protein n=1 Tax=Armillaria novae-zelandiae TaxID=153914 RepID=A0AA39P2C3_9AGAR|nr:hypothetical protein IW261DRAFT_432842 [Armillaria novae-zelandiae]KAK0490205.1 hypothetical protein IW261DRAFT_505 [Armillaria novae-zelandiae]
MVSPEMYSPEPMPHPDLPKLRCLEEVERKLAQKYGMAHEGICIDSTEVRTEAGRRNQSLRAKVTKASLGLLRNNDDEAERLKLHELFHLRSKLSELHIKIGPTPYQASRFWAVLIAIDAYQPTPLHGCVSGALSMKKFLIDELKVPEHRIQCLLGSNNPIPGSPTTPSRANVVNVLYSLIDNVQIKSSDNIVIYYAGHRSSYYCSPAGQCAATGSSTCLNTGVCPIQAMCPMDCDTMNTDGCRIPDISDRELNTLFAQIVRAKGSNLKITLIDGDRYVGSESLGPCLESEIPTISRTSHSNANDMLRVAHASLQHLPRYRSVLSQDWRPDTSFHCLIVSPDFQIAKDSDGGNEWRKEFSRGMIDVLMLGKTEAAYSESSNGLNHIPVSAAVCGSLPNEHLWYPVTWCSRR